MRLAFHPNLKFFQNYMKNNKTAIVILGIAVVIVAMIGIYYYRTGNVPNGQYDNFAKCLALKSAVMYGAYWCPHCQNEKKAFGSSFQYVKYVECGYDSSACVAKGVEAFPTWFVGNQKYVGEQGIDGLSRISGCSITGDATSTATTTLQAATTTIK